MSLQYTLFNECINCSAGTLTKSNTIVQVVLLEMKSLTLNVPVGHSE